jgi:hypothetical protein
MKSLTIKQPWGHAIFQEGKDIENRSWQRSFRSWLALHAAQQPNRYAEFPGRLKVPDLPPPSAAVARVADIVTRSRWKWFDRLDEDEINYGWVLADVTQLEKPIPCKGALGLWEVPPPIFRKVQKQLPRLKLD